MLQRQRPSELRLSDIQPVDHDTLDEAGRIVNDVKRRGEPALREWAERFDGLEPDQPLYLDREGLARSRFQVDEADCSLLERVCDQITAFATAQRQALGDVRVAVPGGYAGHHVSPVEVAGCYAPGGRYPLPSSVLMTVATARAAGVGHVVVASPRPTPVTRLAAWVAGADGLLVAGGAQAIAAMAFGIGVPAADVICGPGNRWVTAAKQIVSGRVGIDLLAGPSELLVIADTDADPEVVAADLIAQAEHDVDAVPWLVTPSAELVDAVDAALERQLADLPTAETARASLSSNGGAVVVADLDEAVAVADRLAPEHLELLGPRSRALADRLGHYGGLFVGSGSAEVFGARAVIAPQRAAAPETGALAKTASGALERQP
ncbi:MAG: histidinol dehydrogenase, partial [Myxococcota bacterium]